MPRSSSTHNEKDIISSLIMAKQGTYILAPNFHFKPVTGPIALGNIIGDPMRPHRALTAIDMETLAAKYPRIEMTTVTDCNIVHGTSRDLSLAVWTQFLQVVSAKVSGGSDSNVRATFDIDALEIAYFVTDPALEEIKERLRVPRVQNVVKAGRLPGLRNPVYMVTGMMTARGFRTQQESAKHKANEVEVSGNVPTPAGDVGLGTSLARSSGLEDSKTWRAGDDIVFAYQLLRIEVKGFKGTKVTYDEFRHKAAFLAAEDEEDNEEEEDVDGSRGQVAIDTVVKENLPDPDVIETKEIWQGDGRITGLSIIDT